jgi:dCMP deaminase
MNNKLISKLFMAREQFILIGLTGRTGSGCTTAANILKSKIPFFPDAKNVQYKSKHFFKDLDIKRYEILRQYTKANWSKFVSIKISDLISGYLLDLDKDYLINFIQKYSPNNKKINRSEIDEILNKKAFSFTRVC